MSAEAARFESIFRPGLFAGQVCLITGGGTGIGRCIAHELAALGATSIVLGRREHVLSETVSEIVAAGGRAEYEVSDIRDEEAVGSAVSRICDRHGRIDGLVNNAGGQFPSPAAALSPKGWRAVVDLNLTGTFQVSRAVYDASMSRHGGKIVSIVAPVQRGFPMFAHSGAARAGVINLTSTLASEWAGDGVRVNAVAPGITLTGGLDQYPPEQLKALSRELEAAPVARFGTESEISAAVVFLLSPAAALLTGVTLQADGGGGLARMGVRNARPKGALEAFNGFQFARSAPAEQNSDE